MTELFGTQVEMDKAATAEWYTEKGPWGCECGHCRNFLKLARENKLPEPIHTALQELNIKAEQAIYARCHKQRALTHTSFFLFWVKSGSKNSTRLPNQ